jgi:hypothetical protein
MTPTHAVKKRRRYRYYVSAHLISGRRSDHGKGWRIPAGDIEAVVLNRLQAFFASDRDLGEALSGADLDAFAVRSAMTKASQLRWSCQSCGRSLHLESRTADVSPSGVRPANECAYDVWREIRETQTCREIIPPGLKPLRHGVDGRVASRHQGIPKT